MVAPPATSSPIRTTVGSRSISTFSASRIASRKVRVDVATAISGSSGFRSVGDVDVVERLFRRGKRAVPSEVDRRIDLLLRVPADAHDVFLGEEVPFPRLLGEESQGVVLL